MSTWQTPVTDRLSGAWHTLADQNRIAGNIDYLATELAAHQLYSGGTIQKTTYIYNDYITVENWSDILEVLNAMLEALSIEGTGEATSAMEFENLNTVEEITLQIYERLELLLSQSQNNHYTGDDIFTQGEYSIYTAGLAI